MLKSIALCLMAAGLAFSTIEVRAEDTAAQALLDELKKDLDPATVPKGYKYDVIEPIARGDKALRQKVEGIVAARFKREGLVDKASWEGFSYLVFANARDAVQYTMTEQDHVDSLKPWLGGDESQKKLNPKAWQGSFLLGAMRCSAVDFLIGCSSLAPGSNVLIYLVLQEPKLRSAKTDDDRKRLVTARAQLEVTGLLKTAQTHLAKAREAYLAKAREAVNP